LAFSYGLPPFFGDEGATWKWLTQKIQGGQCQPAPTMMSWVFDHSLFNCSAIEASNFPEKVRMPLIQCNILTVEVLPIGAGLQQSG
jgi:hypothetical protein